MRRLLSFVPPIAATALYVYLGMKDGFETLSNTWLIVIGLLFVAAVLLSVFRRIGVIFAIAAAALVAIFGLEAAGEMIEIAIGAVLAVLYAVIAIFSKQKSD